MWWERKNDRRCTRCRAAQLCGTSCFGTSDGQQTESWRHNDEMLCTVNIKLHLSVSLNCGLGRSVGIPTSYGLGCPGIEPCGGRGSPPVQTGPSAHPTSCTMGTGSFPGVNCGRRVLLTTRPVGTRFSPVQTGPGAHPASCTMGTGSFPGVKRGRRMLLTTHLLLVPRSWKTKAIPLPTLWATPGL